MLLLILVYCPATFPRTLTEIVQFAFAESVAPLKLMRVEPEVAVGVPVNVPVVQVVVKPLGEAISKPVGRVSEKPTPVNAVALGLASVKVSVLLLPWEIVAGEKFFDSVGTTGRGQPVIWMLSRYIVPVVTLGLPPYCAPAANTLK